MVRQTALIAMLWAAALIFSLCANASPLRSWTAYSQGYTVDATAAQPGEIAMKCVNTTSTQASGASSTVVLNQAIAQPILVTGWSKCESVDEAADNDYSIYVDVTYADGTPLWGQSAPFNTGSHDWQQEKLVIVPTQPVRSMNVYALFRNHSGTVWFDRFAAAQMDASSMFDGQAIKTPSLPVSQTSGWFVRDVERDTDPVPISMPHHNVLGLRLDAGAGNSPLVRASLVNLTKTSRCVTLYFVERFPSNNAAWWSDIRTRVPVKPDTEYANFVHVHAGATGLLSLYPFGCVTNPSRGTAIGIPPDLGPRIARISYNAHAGLFFVAFDLALAATDDDAGHDKAPVAVFRYAIDPNWGFRDAARGYYAQFPSEFARRSQVNGIWMPFTDPAKVSDNQDFHFGFHEADNDVSGDRRRGILSFRYVEPMSYWMTMPKNAPRSYDVALAQVRADAASAADPIIRHQAEAVLSSGSEDDQGRYNVEFRDTPWCNGAVWVLNPNPGMPHAPDTWSKARLNADGEPVPGKADEPDGEYLDSLETWADVTDYRPESLKVLKEPLTFTPSSFLPTCPTWFSVYDDAAALSQDLHRHGKLLMANAVFWRFTAFAPLFDVMGTETTMFTATGDWEPESDAIMNLRRTMSYHRPYLLLLNTDFSKIDSHKIELYFQRCLFYGIFPSMFSPNAADHLYWENPALYNRDRPLFVKYIPIIQRLNAAGWEPITWARATTASNQDTAWIERYGTKYLTLQNPTALPLDVTVRIDAAHFAPGASKTAHLTVSDVMAARTLGDYPAHGTIAVPVHMAASEIQVLSVNISQPR